ncbi:MAG TPA: histidine phosphatase family protein [Cyclobacteriaceae bacterium]|nr:histidine phosphatase family protein [Cyclobacteriaceae bacterium]
MLKVYLLRHGETTFNADNNRYCGRTDAALTHRGIEQAKEVARLVKGIRFDAVYSSPLTRAYQTAQIASGGLPVEKVEKLIEADFGDWEGKTRAEFVAENPKLWERWCDDPDHTPAGGRGETGLEVAERVEHFFQELQEKYPSGTVMVVAHNGVNRLFLARKLGMPLKNYRRIVQENSSITIIELGGPEGFFLSKLNSRG